MSESKQFSEFVPEKRTVKIRGQDYALREMSLAEKIRVVGPIGEFINEMVSHVFIRKDGTNGEPHTPAAMLQAHMQDMSCHSLLPR